LRQPPPNPGLRGADAAGRASATLFRAGGALFRAGATLFRADGALFRAGATLFRADGALFRADGALFRAGSVSTFKRRSQASAAILRDLEW
jgi:hypothetical protein